MTRAAERVPVLLVALLASVALGVGLALAGPADCAWCPSHECLSDATCGRCTCVIVGGETKGRCQTRTD